MPEVPMGPRDVVLFVQRRHYFGETTPSRSLTNGEAGSMISLRDKGVRRARQASFPILRLGQQEVVEYADIRISSQG